MSLLFFIFLAACFVAGATGALFPTGEWYKDLNKPSWTPPDWIFPVAWTTLYLCMSYSAALVAKEPDGSIGLAFWALQLAINTLWTPVFFGLRRIKLGFFVLLGLWIAVAATTISFFVISPLAGWLFVPYLLWVSVAGALNFAVWMLNPKKAAIG